MQSLRCMLLPVVVFGAMLGCHSPAENSSRDSSQNPATDTAIDDSTLLAKIVSVAFEDGGFTVVSPSTDVESLDAQVLNKAYSAQFAQAAGGGYDVDGLMHQLVEKNEESVKLNLESSLQDGYVVDHDGKYAEYFQKGGGGWTEWYEENPLAHGRTRVSLPVYDKSTGYVLVYKSFQTDWLRGAGHIVLYKLSNGRLQEVSRVTVWVS